MRIEDLKVPILLALVILVVPIAGCGEDPDDEYNPSDIIGEYTFALVIEDIEMREVGGTQYYDVFITVDEILFNEIEYNWTDVELTLRDPDFNMIANGIPNDMTWFPGNSTEIQFWYDELSGHIIWVDPLDQIVISYLTIDNQGHRLGIKYLDIGGCWIDLPDNFTDYLD